MQIIDNLKQSIIAKLLILVIIPWIILAIVFGITDLEISKTVVGSNPLWGTIGDEFAYIPADTMITISIAIIVGSFIKDLKKQKIVGVLASLFLIGIYSELDKFYKNKNFYDFFEIFLIIGVIIFALITLNKDWKEYIKIAIVILLLATILTLFVETTKLLCGRVRFKDLNSNFSNYTPWFLPPGPDPDNASFPSGHTANGWMLLPLLILIKKYERKNPIRIFVTLLIIGWGLFIAISRVLIGAHYASDVLFSTSAAAIITIFLYKWFYLNKQEKK